jgi:hypothetical protein
MLMLCLFGFLLVVFIQNFEQRKHKFYAHPEQIDMKRAIDGVNEKSDGEPVSKKPKKNAEEATVCPYLDTINRKVLDFDFEKLCTTTLSNTNVYGCLVCGKYFQGKAYALL